MFSTLRFLQTFSNIGYLSKFAKLTKVATGYLQLTIRASKG